MLVKIAYNTKQIHAIILKRGWMLKHKMFIKLKANVEVILKKNTNPPQNVSTRAIVAKQINKR